MIDGKLTGLGQIKRDFKILTLTPEKKKTILNGTLTSIRKNLMQNKNAQQSPDGQAWQQRAKAKFKTTKTGKKKPLKMLSRIQIALMKKAMGNEGAILYRNKISARIAEEHQRGAILENRITKTKFTLPARPFLDEDDERNAKRMEIEIDKVITDKL
ncbi:phage virion morphogenesis protein [Mannheimia haemolytica]